MLLRTYVRQSIPQIHNIAGSMFSIDDEDEEEGESKVKEEYDRHQPGKVFVSCSFLFKIVVFIPLSPNLFDIRDLFKAEI